MSNKNESVTTDSIIRVLVVAHINMFRSNNYFLDNIFRRNNYFLDNITNLLMQLPGSTTTNLEARINRGLTIFYNNYSKKFLKKNNLSI
jgi:hypothetical protein